MCLYISMFTYIYIYILSIQIYILYSVGVGKQDQYSRICAAKTTQIREGTSAQHAPVAAAWAVSTYIRINLDEIIFSTLRS